MCSLLLHFVVVLSVSFLEGQEKWRRGTIFFARIVTADEWEAERELRTISSQQNYRLLKSPSESPDSPYREMNRIPATPKTSTKQGVSFGLSRASGNKGNASEGSATQAVAGSGTKVCDNFKAFIPVFLCNAKIYFGEM